MEKNEQEKKKKELKKLKKLFSKYLIYKRKQEICFLFSVVYLFTMSFLPRMSNNKRVDDKGIDSTLMVNDMNSNILSYENQYKEVNTVYDMFEMLDALNTMNIDLIKPKPYVKLKSCEYSLTEKENNILIKEKLTYDGLETLVEYMMGNNIFGICYNSREDVINYLAANDERSYQEKMLIIMARYEVTYEELDEVLGVVCAEATGWGENYIDAYAVANTIFNRVHEMSYIDFYSTNIARQVEAPNQFLVYDSGAYKIFVGCSNLIGYQAGIDMFYSEVVMHNYLEFRASDFPLKKYEQFVDGGNKFIVKIKEDDMVNYDVDSISCEELKLSLTK